MLRRNIETLDENIQKTMEVIESATKESIDSVYDALKKSAEELNNIY